MVVGALKRSLLRYRFSDINLSRANCQQCRFVKWILNLEAAVFIHILACHWLAPFAFVLTDLSIYWTIVANITVQVIGVILLGLQFYLYYEVK